MLLQLGCGFFLREERASATWSKLQGTTNSKSAVGQDKGCDWLYFQRLFLWGHLCSSTQLRGAFLEFVFLLASSFSALSLFSSLSPSLLPFTFLHSSPLILHQPLPLSHIPTHTCTPYPSHTHTSNKMLKNTIVPFSRNTPSLLRAATMVNKNKISTLKVPTVYSQITNVVNSVPQLHLFSFFSPPPPFLCLRFTKTQPTNQPLHPRWYITYTTLRTNDTTPQK